MGPDSMFGLSHTAMGIFSPRKSVIIDMIMVQLLAIIVTANEGLGSDTMAYLVAGLFGAFFMLGNVYSRISTI